MVAVKLTPSARVKVEAIKTALVAEANRRRLAAGLTGLALSTRLGINNGRVNEVISYPRGRRQVTIDACIRLLVMMAEAGI